MSNTVILAAKRTPIGSFQGVLSGVSGPNLAAAAIKSALADSGLTADKIDEAIFGCVLPAAVGQAPARQAIRYAGLPDHVPALTINKVCGSGLKAVMLADQAIRAGDAQVVIAGGMENMSQAPYALEKARSGYRLGNGEIVDLLVKDGLWDPYNNCHMGTIAEKCAREYNFTREDQDRYAAESYKRSQKAIADGRFVDEIAVVEIADRKGSVTQISQDEEPGRGQIDKLGGLRPAFDKAGTITAGNASSINDGAAAIVLASEQAAKNLNAKPIARILAQAQFAAAPDWFTTAPAGAIEEALNKAGLKASDIDLWEVNEAFAVVSLVNNQKIGIPFERCNVNGGAVSLGHPIGASGARILATLIHELRKRPDAKRGLATLCIGGGEAVAVIVEKL